MASYTNSSTAYAPSAPLSSNPNIPLDDQRSLPRSPLPNAPGLASPSSRWRNWLCDDGPYAQFIEYRAANNPALQDPDPGSWFNPLEQRKCRATVIELDAENGPERFDFDVAYDKPSGPEEKHLDSGRAKLTNELSGQTCEGREGATNHSSLHAASWPRAQSASEHSISSATSNHNAQPANLKEHLEAATKGEGHRRVVILEGLRPDFVKVLGENYHMDPSTFLIQERRGTSFNYREYIEYPFLPTTLSPGPPPGILTGGPVERISSYCIRYYELWSYNGDLVETFDQVTHASKRNGETAIWCKETTRPIIWYYWRYSKGDRKEVLLVVPRKISVWTKHHATGGWDSVMLVDPQPDEVFAERLPKTGPYLRALPPEADEFFSSLGTKYLKPFEGGYIDFIPPSADDYTNFLSTLTSPSSTTPNPHNGTRHNPNGPPRTSMRDDLIHYYTNHAAHLSTWTDPSLFAKKITAAHYAQLSGFVQHQLDTIRTADWNVRDLSAPDAEVSELEALWRSFRCTQMVRDIEAVMLSIGIAWGDPTHGGPGGGSDSNSGGRPQGAEGVADWRDSMRDFQLVSRQLGNLLADYHALTNALVGLGGMEGNRQACREAVQSRRAAKMVQALTFIATVFIPLTFTTGLFSMFEKILPGRPRHWVYWATSLPTMLVTLAVAAIMQLGYGTDAQWSVDTVELAGRGVAGKMRARTVERGGWWGERATKSGSGTSRKKMVNGNEQNGDGNV